MRWFGTRGGPAAALTVWACMAAAQDAVAPPEGQPPAAGPVELEVVHDWRSSPAAAKLAAALESSTPYRWVDGEAEEMVLVSRIIGGDPPEAALMPLGRRAAELARTGFLLDLTDLSVAQDWRGKLADPAVLDACTIEGRVFCVPVTLRVEGWMMLSRPGFARADVDLPEDWYRLGAAEEPLRAAGIVPLAIEGPDSLADALASFTLAAGGREAWLAAHRDGDAAAVAGPAFTRGFEELGKAKDLARGPEPGGATPEAGARPAALVTADGSWSAAAEGDVKCLPGLGTAGPLAVTGDGFFFPNRGDPALARAQLAFAALLLDPAVQTALSNDLGVLPARKGVDLTSLHPCTRRGLVALAAGGSVPAGDLLLPPGLKDQTDSLLAAFWDDPAMTPADLQARYAEVIAQAR